MALKIECPHCGRQYLPGEIYLPNHFLGQPKNVERDIYGKVLSNDGIMQDLREEYICDGCGRLMKIQANVKFNVQVEEEKAEYTTTLKKKPKIIMKEL